MTLGSVGKECTRGQQTPIEVLPLRGGRYGLISGLRRVEALKAFELVVSRYPDSTKAPGALFKIGRLQQAAGKTTAARASFEKVLKDYPDSPAAGLARQRLEQLGTRRY